MFAPGERKREGKWKGQEKNTPGVAERRVKLSFTWSVFSFCPFISSLSFPGAEVFNGNTLVFFYCYLSIISFKGSGRRRLMVCFIKNRWSAPGREVSFSFLELIVWSPVFLFHIALHGPTLSILVFLRESVETQCMKGKKDSDRGLEATRQLQERKRQLAN